MIYSHTEKIEELYQQVFERFFLLSIAVGMICILTFIALMNSMAASLQERIAEFAVLQALDSPPSQLMRLLVIEGALITSAGGLVGIIIGISLSYHLLFALSADTLIFPISLTVAWLVASPLLGILSAYIPARMISRQNVLPSLQQS